MKYKIAVVILYLGVSCNHRNQQLTTAKDDSLLLFMQYTIGYAISNLDEKKASFLLDSIGITIDNNAPIIKAHWYLLKSETQTISFNWKMAHFYLDSAVTIFSQLDSSQKELLKAKSQLAGLLVRQQKWDTALVVALDAYYMARKIDSAVLPLTELRLAEIYTNLGDRGAVKKYLVSGLGHSKANAVMQVYFKMGLAKYYDDMGNLDSAIAYYKDLQANTALNNINFSAVMTENLGVLYTRQNKAVQALQYLLKAMPLSKASGTWDALSMYNLANAYTKNGMYRQSMQYLDSALSSNKTDIPLSRKIWKLRADNMVLQSQPLAAYKYLDSAYQQFEPEVDSSMAKYARELDAKYRVRENEERIKSLALANRIKDKTNQLQTGIILSITVTVLLAAAVLWFSWRRVRLANKLRESELRWQSLGTQIESHFLFNSLSSLLSLVRSGDRKTAVTYLLSFSRLIRSFLEAARQKYVLLTEEVELLSAYLEVQAINSGQHFTYEIVVYDGYKEDKVYLPPLLLQPFVENAIIHGTAKLNATGKIRIEITKDEGVLTCTIDDNGEGFSASTTNKSRRSRAIEITKERLDIMSRYTGWPASVEVMNKKEHGGQGVQVILIIPYK